MNTPAPRKLARRLTVQALLAPLREGGHVFGLAEHLRPRFRPEDHDAGPAQQGVATPSSTRRQTEQVTEQVVPEGTAQVGPLVQLTDVQWTIVEHADTPRALNELLDITGYKQRPHFKAQHLEPLLDGGVLRMTVPDKPTSSKQQYVLTANGLKLKALRDQTATSEDQQTD
jgi:ATP-dependent DNA helicase RecG